MWPRDGAVVNLTKCVGHYSPEKKKQLNVNIYNILQSDQDQNF